MASRRAVSAALKMLALTFAGDVSGERVDLYAAALEDVTDGALAAATLQLVKTHKGEWIPVPAVIREAAGVDALPDIDALIRRIDRLGEPNPGYGWLSPDVETVRMAMGDAVADAYADVGAERLFADQATTRDIARHDFRRALALAARRAPLLIGGATPKRITGDAA